jgi:membrane-associated PAP2 superfamily phosphatase
MATSETIRTGHPDESPLERLIRHRVPLQILIVLAVCIIGIAVAFTRLGGEEAAPLAVAAALVVLLGDSLIGWLERP